MRNCYLVVKGIFLPYTIILLSYLLFCLFLVFFHFMVFLNTSFASCEEFLSSFIEVIGTFKYFRFPYVLSFLFTVVMQYIGGMYIAEHIKAHYFPICIGIFFLSFITFFFVVNGAIIYFLPLILFSLGNLLLGCFLTLKYSYQSSK